MIKNEPQHRNRDEAPLRRAPITNSVPVHPVWRAALLERDIEEAPEVDADGRVFKKRRLNLAHQALTPRIDTSQNTAPQYGAPPRTTQRQDFPPRGPGLNDQPGRTTSPPVDSSRLSPRLSPYRSRAASPTSHTSHPRS